jgi:fibronectin type 3 domain-containing protein
MQMRYLLGTILLLVGVVASLHGQPQSDNPSNDELNNSLRVQIGLIAQSGSDSIVLRWAPSKPAVWLIGNKVGYRIERATLGRNGAPGAFKALVDTAVKPWGYEQWLNYSESHPIREGADSANYPAIAYNLLDQYSQEGPARDDYPSDELASISERKSELEMRFGFAMFAVDRSIDAAEGLGLRYVDRSITRGESYIYRVYLAGSAGDYRLDTGTVSVRAVAPEAIKHGEIVATGGEKEILIRWGSNKYYGAYFIDRSDDNGATFKRMNKIPRVTLRGELPTESDEERFLDTATTNYKEYRYRIYGTTPFAGEDLIGEVRGSSRDATPPEKPFLPNPEHISRRAVRVHWVMSDPVVADLAGFHVLRGGTDSGPFVEISRGLLGAGDRELIDTTFHDGGTNYYLVEALDTARNRARSNSAYVTLIDSTPPGAPRWISGKMDTLGVVTLRLHANAEADLMGYRILRANAPDHEFSVVTESYDPNGIYEATDTLYRDTVEVRTLTRYAYYRAVALDGNYNESIPSEILAVSRPDLIAPVAPVIVNTGVTDSTVLLDYVPSSSEDVAWHIIYRKSDEASAWDSIARVGSRDSLFVDHHVTKNIAYHYAIRAVDSSGLRSEVSSSVVARPYDSGLRPGVKNLTASYDPAKRRVELRWEYSGLNEDYWFVVHRSGENGALRQFARVAPSDHIFVDEQPLSGTDDAQSTPTYAVRVVTQSGAVSTLDTKVQVVMPR